ncbi:5-oxoprolinase subunit PxpA [Muriicola sp. Z0-33]|uniref:5-oxoprolinase subunit PxpA n=1 Tax=Muriicola sp. Z0-33 TaxID=2816957 RepID=UPI002237B141|nr:5-oxoprolinase subunit PxpA [Muriicola sp. Z0-33]MCW5515399.1 5-oxoprolinase subunit PxpA [Muriicola sp. Z0-33]
MYIDINCDVGEGVGNEKALFPLISSCNIACGGHAGDLATIKRLVLLSKSHNLKVGAHPSYPDRANFGRITVQMSRDHLIESIREQLAVITDILEHEGVNLHHIKAHGALYNDLASDVVLAEIFLDAIHIYDKEPLLYVPYNSELEKLALSRGHRVAYEAFGDRNYNDDLSLVSRSESNALIVDPEVVLHHVLSIVQDQKVKTITGKFVEIKADTICIHGDTPSAVQIIAYLSNELGKYNIGISK